MIFQNIQKKDILTIVMEEISLAKKEIYLTMLLSEEKRNPLPITYQKLLQRKAREGVKIYRFGFGTEDAVNEVNARLEIPKNNYRFSFSTEVDKYQRLVILDKKVLFTKIGDNYFFCKESSIVNGFVGYFRNLFTNSKKLMKGGEKYDRKRKR